jgi:hypothetical protein
VGANERILVASNGQPHHPTHPINCGSREPVGALMPGLVVCGVSNRFATEMWMHISLPRSNSGLESGPLLETPRVEL